MIRQLFLCFLLAIALAGCRQKDSRLMPFAPVDNQQAIVLLAAADATPAAMQALEGAFGRMAQRFGFIMPARGADSGAAAGRALYLRGYFSAMTDDDDTIRQGKNNDDNNGNRLVYVFDILNRAGERLHRVRGFYPLPAKATGGTQAFWQYMNTTACNAIAADVLAKINTWKKRQ